MNHEMADEEKVGKDYSDKHPLSGEVQRWRVEEMAEHSSELTDEQDAASEAARVAVEAFENTLTEEQLKRLRIGR